MKDAPNQALSFTHPTAEITTLTAMRRGSDEDAAHIAELLCAADFADPRRQVIFQAIVNRMTSIEPADDAAILSECLAVARDMKLDVRITQDYLNSLDGEPLRGRAYANTVKRFSWLRQAGDFAYWLVGELQGFPDPDSLYTDAQERMTSLQPPKTDKRFVYGWNTVEDHSLAVEQRIADRAAGKSNPYTWPWQSWQAMVRPLRPGMVGIVAAPDGMGKTTYLEIIAEHWAKAGLHTVYVHLEDDLEYKLDRRLARWARVAMDIIEDGRLDKEQLNGVRAAQRAIDKTLNTLHYFHAPGMTMTDIIRELESKVAEGVCQAVVFDYLDKVQPSRSQAKLFGENIWERQASDVEALKVFAERNRVPVLTAAQGNKSMQDSGVQTRKNIAGSGAKTQKAQLVIILTRDLVTGEGMVAQDGSVLAVVGEYSPIVHVRIDKQNRGKTGACIDQFLVGRFFNVVDMEVQRAKLEY